MDRHLAGGWRPLGLISAVAVSASGDVVAQDKNGYRGVPRTFLWANDAIEFTDTSQYKKDPPYIIGFSNASVSNIWRVGMAHAIEAAAARHADKIKKLIITDAHDDRQADRRHPGSGLARRRSSDRESATPRRRSIPRSPGRERGIPVVMVDRRVTSDNFVTFVTASDWRRPVFRAVDRREAPRQGQYRHPGGRPAPARTRTGSSPRCRCSTTIPTSRSSSCCIPTGAR